MGGRTGRANQVWPCGEGGQDPGWRRGGISTHPDTTAVTTRPPLLSLAVLTPSPRPFLHGSSSTTSAQILAAARYELNGNTL